MLSITIGSVTFTHPEDQSEMAEEIGWFLKQHGFEVAAPPAPVAEEAAAEVEAVREVATPQALGYIQHLPQVFEFLRDLFTALMHAGASDATIQLLLNAAIEAKDLGKLKEWKEAVLTGCPASLRKDRHPNEFVPSMIQYLKEKLTAWTGEGQTEEVQQLVRRLAQEVSDSDKGRFWDWVDSACAAGKAKFFGPAWEELEATKERTTVTSPWRFFQKIVDDRHEQEQMDTCRQPAKISMADAVDWVKSWFPEYDSSKLIRDNIERDFQPLAKRTTVERRVEAAYFALRTQVVEKQMGAALDAIVAAWGDPDSNLLSEWMILMERKYTADGKRYAYSSQSFDVIAAAYFLDVLRRKSCQGWVEAHKFALQSHPKIGTLYAQVFPRTEE